MDVRTNYKRMESKLITTIISGFKLASSQLALRERWGADRECEGIEEKRVRWEEKKERQEE